MSDSDGDFFKSYKRISGTGRRTEVIIFFFFLEKRTYIKTVNKKSQWWDVA